MALNFPSAWRILSKSLYDSKALISPFLENLPYKIYKHKFFIFLFEVQIILKASCKF